MSDSENKQMVQVNAEKISAMTGYKPEEVAIIKNTVAKGTTDTELAYFLSVCKSVELNPFMKEIWCYKDTKGNLLVFAGRDGFLKKAQMDKRWDGMLSAYVCENDEFELDIPNGKVIHKVKGSNRGHLLGAYAIIKPKGCSMPTVAWAEIKAYDKGWNTWKTNPEAMIQKVAETHALKKAFGVAGLQVEDDFQVVNNVVVPVAEVADFNELDEAKDKIISGLTKYKGEDKEDLKKMCIEKSAAGEFDIALAKNIAEKIGIEL